MKYILSIALSIASFAVVAQDTIPLKDLSFWKSMETQNWQIGGDATVNPEKNEALTISKGAGILANLPDSKNRSNLISLAEYGDLDVSFDFMMAKHSNSGFYLQGRYELQLCDSWGKQHPSSADCGGIYARRRWNPDEQLFDGHAPRLNACLAPGLWQHVEISFQAPRFDAAGNKIANARVLKVLLNGSLIHENVELSGPTGGPISEQEAARGPIMIQGDHGPIAYRNFVFEDKSGVPVESSAFDYGVIYGSFRYPIDFAGKKIDKKGSSKKLTWEVVGKDNDFAVIFNGSITCPKAGQHHFILQAAGKTILKVDGKELLGDRWTYASNQRSADLELAAGPHTIEVVNYKMDGWMPPFLGLWVEGPGARPGELHSSGSTLSLEASDPIELDAATPKVFRSFMDISLPNTLRSGADLLHFNDPKRKRIVHAVQVGHPTQLHYTYDLDNGAVAQIWKGKFLNTAPMWDNRGDGSSRPLGAVLPLDDIQTVVAKADLFDLKTSENDPMPGLKPKGYDLDEPGYPTFRYLLNGTEIQDQIRVVEGKTLDRTLTFSNLEKGQDLKVRLAIGKTIEKTGDHLWSVDDKRYFIKVPKGAKPMVESNGTIFVLYLPASAEVAWSVWW